MKNAPPQHKPIRKSRAKSDIVWEKLDLAANGVYKTNYKNLNNSYPKLTKMELKVSVLIYHGLDSRQISEALLITEHRVENHRFEVRKKLGLKHEDELKSFLRKS